MPFLVGFDGRPKGAATAWRTRLRIWGDRSSNLFGCAPHPIGMIVVFFDPLMGASTHLARESKYGSDARKINHSSRVRLGDFLGKGCASDFSLKPSSSMQIRRPSDCGQPQPCRRFFGNRLKMGPVFQFMNQGRHSPHPLRRTHQLNLRKSNIILRNLCG